MFNLTDQVYMTSGSYKEMRSALLNNLIAFQYFLSARKVGVFSSFDQASSLAPSQNVHPSFYPENYNFCPNRLLIWIWDWVTLWVLSLLGVAASHKGSSTHSLHRDQLFSVVPSKRVSKHYQRYLFSCFYELGYVPCTCSCAAVSSRKLLSRDEISIKETGFWMGDPLEKMLLDMMSKPHSTRGNQKYWVPSHHYHLLPFHFPLTPHCPVIKRTQFKNRESPKLIALFNILCILI